MGLLDPNVNYNTGTMVSPTRNLQATVAGLGDQFSRYRQEKLAKEELATKNQLAKDTMEQRERLANLPYQRQQEERAKQASVMASVPKNASYSETGTTGLDAAIGNRLQQEYGDLLSKDTHTKAELDKLTAIGDETSNILGMTKKDEVLNPQEYGRAIYNKAIAANLGSDTASKMMKDTMSMYAQPKTAVNDKQLVAKAKAAKAIFDAKNKATDEKFKLKSSGKGDGTSSIKNDTDLNDLIEKKFPEVNWNIPFTSKDLGGKDLKLWSDKMKDAGYSAQDRAYAISLAGVGEIGDWFGRAPEANQAEMEATLVKLSDPEYRKLAYANGAESLSKAEYDAERKLALDEFNLSNQSINAAYGAAPDKKYLTTQQREDAALSKILAAGGDKWKNKPKGEDITKGKKSTVRYGGKNSLIGKAMATPAGNNDLVNSMLKDQEGFSKEFTSLEPSEQKKIVGILDSKKSKDAIEKELESVVKSKPMATKDIPLSSSISNRQKKNRLANQYFKIN